MLKHLLTLSLIILGAIGMNAQTISGTVTSTNGSAAVANHTVYIYSLDSINSPNPSPYTATTTTSSTGAYSFTSVPANNYGFQVYLYNCLQQQQAHFLQTNSGTANFSICVSGPINCVASFTTWPDSNNINLIHFYDQSTGSPTSWTWNFGDGSSASTQNPSHTYASNGNYTVSLLISSSTCSDTITQVITVGGTTPCAANFSSTPINPPLTITFSDLSTGIPLQWLWDLGDGTSSTFANPTHTYLSIGTYNVTLKIITANCTDSITIPVVVTNPNPCQSIYNYYPDSTYPNSINFSDASTGSPYAWTWNFGDGTTSNQQYPTHVFANPGTYNVSLAIVAGTPNQPCTSTSTQSITIGSTGTTYAISGAVYANSTMVLQGTVALFDTQTSQFITSTPIDSTGYYFANVAIGIYNIFAIPDTTTAIGQNFAPTYYGDIIFWSGATAVSITNANQSSKIINLVTIPSVPGGNGSISGNVGTGSKAGTADAIVNLLNNSLQLVATTKTDANGDYSFANLAYDTYKIWVEIAGKTTTPITVTLTSTSGSSNTNDFIVTNNTVIPKTTSVNNNLLVGEFKLYPNPVSNVLNIEIKTEEIGIYSFNMFNVTGQLISSEQINITSGSNLIKLNTNELSQGTYILRIQSSGSNSIQKLFVK